MAEYIERTAELILAVNAGARVIENTKRYHGASYCVDVFAEKPKEIPYLKAAEVLREFEDLPTADVAPVVRCRNCKWWDDSLCTNINGAFCVVENGDWFCASGERKTDDVQEE